MKYVRKCWALKRYAAKDYRESCYPMRRLSASFNEHLIGFQCNPLNPARVRLFPSRCLARRVAREQTECLYRPVRVRVTVEELA